MVSNFDKVIVTIFFALALFCGCESRAAGDDKPLIPKLVQNDQLAKSVAVSIFIPVQNCDDGEGCNYVQMDCKDSETIEVKFSPVTKITLDFGDTDVKLISGGKVFNIWVESANHNEEEGNQWDFSGNISDPKAFIETALHTSRAAIKVQQSLYTIAINADWRSFAQQCAAAKQKPIESSITGNCLFDNATYGNENSDLEVKFRKGKDGERGVQLDSNILAIHMSGVGEISNGLGIPYVSFSDVNDSKLFDSVFIGYKISTDKIVEDFPNFGGEASDAILLSGLRASLSNLHDRTGISAISDFFQLKSCTQK